VKQHLVNRDSSVTNGASAAGLNPDHIRAVEWWTDSGFSDRTTLAAAELVAFEMLQPALRSRGGITASAQALADDAGFRAQITTLLGTPSGRLDIPQLIDLIDRVAELEARVARLEASPVAVNRDTSTLTVYADGSGTTGGPAGIGFVVLSDGRPFGEGSLSLADATNQQAELRAASFALESIPEGREVVLYSDSKYVVRNFNDYLDGWRDRGWRTGGGQPVANLALWEGLIAAVDRHRKVQFKWMRGHVVRCPTCKRNGTDTKDVSKTCGDEWHDHAEGNRRADLLAGEAREAARRARETLPP
jgi:ribonuclease HI